MEEASNVLLSHSSTASSASSAPSARDASQTFQQKHAADSLIQVIEKLSKIVEKRPQRRCTLAAQKRPPPRAKRNCKEEEVRLDGGAALSPPGISSTATDSAGEADGSHRRMVTCYQCSLCPYLSQTLPLLKEHLKHHNEQHSDLILMCSECRFTSRDQDQLEAHVRLHIDTVKEECEWSGGVGGVDGVVAIEAVESSPDGSRELPQKKKWYSYEEYGLYRCLICSYVCSQQRMLKTHAWKHAGLVDCCYPIFEDEDGASARRGAPTAANAPATREEIVVLSPVLQASGPIVTPKTEEESAYPIKDLTSEETVVEVQVTTEAESEVESDGTSVADSLLSSAQKIINSGPNSAGHINVIVERLPSAEDSVMATNPLLLSPDLDRDKNKSLTKEEGQGAAEGEVPPGGHLLEAGVTPAVGSDSPRDENVPPAVRKRTHSESLRLHSLAAEVLVAMPMRTPELLTAGSRGSLRSVTAQAQSPNSGFKPAERTSDAETTAALRDLELHGGGREEELGSLCLGEGDEEGPAAKAGISLSLLTVIEKLRERSDQNASDEDILKELQDNAQFHNPGMDGLVASADGGLVDFIPGSERPYRCRLCHYSSGNKGYIKQHLRVHRERKPYQCPICEHIASDSQDLESHMMHHCKTRMYQCKQCPGAFHYKSQLRSHEREQHSLSVDIAALTPVTETAAVAEEAEQVTDEECSLQKMYKCDVCDYTSSTYVGVRNHRRIHNSDKPYRCSLCGYVCSHPPSLKSHMWKHAGDQNYNYEQVNKAINEAISQSSRRGGGVGRGVKPLILHTVNPSYVAVDGSAGSPTDTSQRPGGSQSPQGKDHARPQSRPRTSQTPAQGPPMEYCVLLFCCCICGFESTSKERLMEHMKEHEGDIISIILNREQQQQAEAQ
uniref:Zinc finger protein 507 n=1 Tax=Gasterosteus aculeatus TaxID=69293 RepID=G3PMG9_GASAC